VIPLSYDDLPPGSDIRREHDADGTVRITVPAGEPPAAALHQTLRDALSRGTLESIPLLVVALIVCYLGIRSQRVSGVELWVAWAFFAVFCGALVALVVWIRYGTMADALRAGRRQATVIAVTPSRLLVETTGPFAVASYYFSAQQIRRIRIGRSGLLDDMEIRRAVSHLSVERPDGRAIALLPGRSRAELAAIASMLRAILNLPA
jgi:hypothetical protein